MKLPNTATVEVTTFFRTNLRPISPAGCAGFCGRKMMMNKPDEKLALLLHGAIV